MKMENPLKGYNVVKRDGAVVPFNTDKIALAIQRCYLDVYNNEAGERMRAIVTEATEKVAQSLTRDKTRASFHIEDIQDAVELTLMRMGDHKLARGYVLFRQQQAEKRAQAIAVPAEGCKYILQADGGRQPLDLNALRARVAELSMGLNVDIDAVVARADRELFDGATITHVQAAVRMAARTLIEQEPQYDRLVARLKLADVYAEVFGREVPVAERGTALREGFAKLIQVGVDNGRIAPELARFDLSKLAQAFDPDRDTMFTSLGIETLHDRYLLHVNKTRIEVPQTFFMRIAMGLALGEIDREERAIEFYNVLSRGEFLNSTPTLFNAGTCRPQLASCFLTTVADDLDGIYEAIKENALLQKYAGGLGNDWTSVRALGSHIKGTNGESQGVVPFLKVVNDTAVAVNQGGKRPGAVCSYLETWHLDIEEFLELRKNTGDDRRRTHDMNTANWIPDLFMVRVMEKRDWTLFSPSNTPDLHELYGNAFTRAYEGYEAQVAQGQFKGPYKVVKAVDLWRKMLTMLFETGHPWITFKDPCNLRSPQQHVGVVHSSNLCTEITLNTSADEIAVCNIGSINLVAHLTATGIDTDKLRRTVRTAMRMLDNVIDINHYTVAKARKSNLKHRPVGLGQMGFHDALQALGIPYASEAAVQFADETTERMCFEAYSASCDLAIERGAYSSFKGSLWSKGVLPLDSIQLVEAARPAGYCQIDGSSVLGTAWDALRERIQQHGMRNSNCVAIAPTATIGNIVGVSAGTDPHLGNLSVKSNMSGEFTIINERLVAKLKELGAWDSAMVADLKHFDGSVLGNARVPQEVQNVFATAFEIGPSWLIEAGARRQKWIDQAQSLNVYMAGASGKLLDETYKHAWLRGLKTTYYLRTRAATHAEKSTSTRTDQLSSVAVSSATQEPSGPVCMLRPGDAGFNECEACQ